MLTGARLWVRSALRKNALAATTSLVGLSRKGRLQLEGDRASGVGSDATDFDNDGWVDIVYNDLSGQVFGLLKNEAGKSFTDVTWSSKLGALTSNLSGRSIGFIDYDVGRGVACPFPRSPEGRLTRNCGPLQSSGTTGAFFSPSFRDLSKQFYWLGDFYEGLSLRQSQLCILNHLQPQRIRIGIGTVSECRGSGSVHRNPVRGVSDPKGCRRMVWLHLAYRLLRDSPSLSCPSWTYSDPGCQSGCGRKRGC
jgi:hypothetical protein